MKQKTALSFQKWLLKYSIILFFLTLLSSCQREISFQEDEYAITLHEQIHKSKIELWLKLIPLQGNFAHIDYSKIKTISNHGILTTRMQIGSLGNALYFISNKNQFHVYGINSSRLNRNNGYNGIVDVYDFQTISKKGFKYSRGVLIGEIKYLTSLPIINAYKGYYPQDSYQIPNSSRTTSESSLIKGIRKFFCELFGGTWYESIAGNATNSNGSCSTGGSGSDDVQNLPPPDISGNHDLGLIWQNLNNPDYFDATSNLWNNINSGLSAGGTNVNWAINGTSYIDPAFLNPDEIRSLYFILNTQYNQQPATPFDGTIEEILDHFVSYSNSNQVPIPILPWLLKAGANGAADALTQALFIYLTEDDCPSFGAAFGHSKFSKLQVARSSLEGLLPWRTPGGKIGQAAATAVGDILINMIEGKYGTSDYYTLGADFMLSFFSHFGGQELGELASRYSIPKIGKGLINKFGVSYRTATGWLGGGLQSISKTFSHQAAYGGTITATRIMKGWAIGKVAVIGRNMDDRVKPFANQLASELGHPVLTWNGFNPNLTVEQNVANNRAWIKSLKDQGYTFYDVGLDPRYTSGAATGAPDFTEGPYYSMELNEIFR